MLGSPVCRAGETLGALCLCPQPGAVLWPLSLLPGTPQPHYMGWKHSGLSGILLLDSVAVHLLTSLSLSLQSLERRGAGSRILLAAGGTGGRGDSAGGVHTLPGARQEQMRGPCSSSCCDTSLPLPSTAPRGPASSWSLVGNAPFRPAWIAGPVKPELPAPAVSIPQHQPP